MRNKYFLKYFSYYLRSENKRNSSYYRPYNIMKAEIEILEVLIV